MPSSSEVRQDGRGAPDVAPLGEGCRTFGQRRFDFSREVAIMGIVNRTRDSFHDEGRTFAEEAALAAVDTALAQGADWIDIGGVPFSPGAEAVSVSEEIDRVLPIVAGTRMRSDAVISVDTFRTEVARRALEAGATAINDTSGLRDPEMADLAAERGAVLVITHSKAAPRTWLERPSYDDVVDEVVAFLSDRVELALAHGVPPEMIVVDPGHDLNKNTIHSLELTRRLAEVSALGYPLLASVSNKDFIAESLGRGSDTLREGTVATLALCMLHGARILRVHDVKSAVAAATMVSAIMGWRRPTDLRHNVEPGPHGVHG